MDDTKSTINIMRVFIKDQSRKRKRSFDGLMHDVRNIAMFLAMDEERKTELPETLKTLRQEYEYAHIDKPNAISTAESTHYLNILEMELVHTLKIV